MFKRFISLQSEWQGFNNNQQFIWFHCCWFMKFCSSYRWKNTMQFKAFSLFLYFSIYLSTTIYYLFITLKLKFSFIKLVIINTFAFDFFSLEKNKRTILLWKCINFGRISFFLYENFVKFLKRKLFFFI